MARKPKKITGICIYCKGYVEYPEDGVEYVKTKRKDTFLFHTMCFIRNRKKVNTWM